MFLFAPMLGFPSGSILCASFYLLFFIFFMAEPQQKIPRQTMTRENLCFSNIIVQALAQKGDEVALG